MGASSFRTSYLCSCILNFLILKHPETMDFVFMPLSEVIKLEGSYLLISIYGKMEYMGRGPYWESGKF
ncbi:hypothetical protein CMV_001278 [Castanea mollissima]|uniref:Uncharacterized protein n=1 Tax=Castanea mollissima TaxID=60419 RepID=A0A8J4VX20_9ROSI|nr:hypothetical protein CMV_001278 [Castanea mollissima]